MTAVRYSLPQPLLTDARIAEIIATIEADERARRRARISHLTVADLCGLPDEDFAFYGRQPDKGALIDRHSVMRAESPWREIDQVLQRVRAMPTFNGA